MTYTCASLFSGGGGFDIGAKAAGFTPVCANEYDPAIAAVYAENLGNHIQVGDILEENPALWPRVDLLHASPPCPNFSTAKTNAAETPHDIALATKVAEFITVLKPRWFTLENVRAYRKSASFAIICKALAENGYWYDAPILNSADFGVPQTRQRLFLRAVRGGMVPPLPPPTRWIGWHEAIADIIDTLPETEFAEWQLKRLPEGIGDSRLFSRTELVTLQNGDMVGRADSQPSMTIVASDGERPGNMARAFIANTNNSERDDVLREKVEPAYTVTGAGSIGRSRAFIVDGKLSTSGKEKSLQIVGGGSPVGAVVSANSYRRDTRAWLSQGRVVKMTPRALARFQSFPDSYALPNKASLACRIIGNAVPPLLAEAACRSLLR